MSIVKSFSVGEGDMFYIKHGSDSFTMIDCCMSDEGKDGFINEIHSEASGKGISRFISTHPDDDHLRCLVDLDNDRKIQNFYCVKNEARKADQSDDFDRYCELRDHARKAFYISRGCTRKWLNESDSERGGSGIHFLWPVTSNQHYKSALADAKDGKSSNNISCILTYSLNGGAKLMWMGDLETGFMEKIKNDITIDGADILFAPHHGRDSGRVPEAWLEDIDPRIIIVGEAPSSHLNYYPGYNTITQNSAGDITFDCVSGKVHIYVSKRNYSVEFLANDGKSDTYGNYIGTLNV